MRLNMRQVYRVRRINMRQVYRVRRLNMRQVYRVRRINMRQVRIKGGVAESVKEVFASFCVRVGDLHFWREEGGKVSVELGGVLDLASEVRCVKSPTRTQKDA